MNTASALTAAKALILDPDKWVNMANPFRYDENKKPLNFCVGTALAKVAGEHYATYMDARRKFCQAASINNPADSLEPIFRWNDAPERTHEEVLAAFDRAIEITKGA